MTKGDTSNRLAGLLATSILVARGSKGDHPMFIRSLILPTIIAKGLVFGAAAASLVATAAACCSNCSKMRSRSLRSEDPSNGSEASL
jgi:hypothetical protein